MFWKFVGTFMLGMRALLYVLNERSLGMPNVLQCMGQSLRKGPCIPCDVLMSYETLMQVKNPFLRLELHLFDTYIL